jgi:hypothetical protein
LALRGEFQVKKIPRFHFIEAPIEKEIKYYSYNTAQQQDAKWT